ncbi:hypothetical protein GCM10011571_14730 [Marinithermofilum abyssi]|uniref:Uncharacterized protein n=1 Tax=Marinithermofilum abyssi TaxID=1571185 RepID=A0A8J2VHH8_9BACL|nr:hypothetical protein GCM10011571_14730 [Marinithermofilum abyssi]
MRIHPIPYAYGADMLYVGKITIKIFYSIAYPTNLGYVSGDVKCTNTFTGLV